MQYGEFRSGFDRDTEDTRMVVYGLRYLLQTYLHRQWTIEDVEKADKFYRSGVSAKPQSQMQCGSTSLEPLYAMVDPSQSSMYWGLMTTVLRDAARTRRLVLLLFRFQKACSWNLFRTTMVCHLPTCIHSTCEMMLAVVLLGSFGRIGW